MMKYCIFSVFLMLCGYSVAKVEVPEILEEIDQKKVAKILEYNAIHLAEQLYLSKRHRIVKVDENILLNSETFTITPFEDIGPVLVERVFLNNSDDVISWGGFIDVDLPEELEISGAKIPITIGMVAWDIDALGNASESLRNQYQHSPMWSIDKNGVPVLDELMMDSQSSKVFGGPPDTPEDIEYHKKIKKLNKRVFYASSTTINLPGKGIFILQPLKYSPKYSLLFEFDQEKQFDLDFDVNPFQQHESLSLNPESQEKENNYQKYLKAIPKEVKKMIKGEFK